MNTVVSHAMEIAGISTHVRAQTSCYAIQEDLGDEDETGYADLYASPVHRELAYTQVLDDDGWYQDDDTSKTVRACGQIEYPYVDIWKEENRDGE